MLLLSWYALYSLIFFLIVARLTSFQIEHLFQLFLGALILGLSNFLLVPLLLGLGLRMKAMSFTLLAFVMNFLIFNLTTGLIDEFNEESWVTALFGALIFSFLQLEDDLSDPLRRNLIT